jgi:hypothetical protein
MATPRETRSRRTRAAMEKRMLIEVDLFEQIAFNSVKERGVLDVEKDRAVEETSIYASMHAVRLTAR